MMSRTWCRLGTIYVIVPLLILSVTISSATLTGDNVCAKSVRSNVSRLQQATRSTTVKYYTSCKWGLGRCTAYKKSYSLVSVTIFHNVNSIHPFCCNGYYQVGNRCQACNGHRHGQNCSSFCTCQNGAACDHVTGNCTCTAGWRGTNCDEPCINYRFGQNCSNICTCQNGATCDHVTGNCTCTAGWRGTNCDEPCINYRFGQNCSSICTCQNGATCDHVTGNCTCTAGWRGTNCDEPCISYRFGQNCSSICTCQNDATCDHATGNCTCTAGWSGTNCDEQCPAGTYGVGCRHCSCQNGSTCDHVSGGCFCQPGYHGNSCEYTCASSLWKFGHGCNGTCSCERDSSFNCSHVDGHCNCKRGWEGPVCSVASPNDTPTPQCQLNCSTCDRGEKCNPCTGLCSNYVAGQTSEEEKGNKWIWGVVAGGTVLLVVAIVVVLTIVWRRNRRKHKAPIGLQGNAGSSVVAIPLTDTSSPRLAEYRTTGEDRAETSLSTRFEAGGGGNIHDQSNNQTSKTADNLLYGGTSKTADNPLYGGTSKTAENLLYEASEPADEGSSDGRKGALVLQANSPIYDKPVKVQSINKPTYEYIPVEGQADGIVPDDMLYVNVDND